jgi:hypothetical protein
MSPSPLKYDGQGSNRDDDEEEVNMSVASVTSNDNTDDSNVRSDWVVESVFQHLLNSVCIDMASNIHQHLKTGGGYGLGIPMTSHVLSRPDGTTTTTSPIIQSRRQLYPELYQGKSEAEIQQLLNQYAVDLPMVDGRKERSRKRLEAAETAEQWGTDEEEDDEVDKPKTKGKKKKIGAGSDDEDDEDYQMEEDKDDDEMVTADGRQKSSTSSSTGQKSETTTSADSGVAATDNVAPATLGSVDIWGNRPPAEPTHITCRCTLCGRHVSTSRFASHLDKCMGLSTRPLAGSASRG